MKTTEAKVFKLFAKARVQKSDVKPVLNCINVQEIEGNNWIACTDSFRLHAYKDTNIDFFKMPIGNYNIDNFTSTAENYPVYSTLDYTKDNQGTLHDTTGIDKLFEDVQKLAINDVKRNTCTLLDLEFNKDYLLEACEWLQSKAKLHGLNGGIKVYTNGSKPLIIQLLENNEVIAYAMIMPLYK